MAGVQKSVASTLPNARGWTKSVVQYIFETHAYRDSL